jgi:hypothetical protein
MSNNKQSSVEWVIGEIIKHQMTFYGTSSMPLRIIKKAREMHKEEIMNAYKIGKYESDKIVMSDSHYAKQYYTETFNSDEA